MVGIEKGTRGTAEIEVEERHCTQRGEHKIFSTPNMVSLLERSAIEALTPFMDEAQISVGTKVEVQHLAPTPIGMRVRAESVIREVDENRVCFDIEIFDDSEIVGTATHERYVLNLERYIKRLSKKSPL